MANPISASVNLATSNEVMNGFGVDESGSIIQVEYTGTNVTIFGQEVTIVVSFTDEARTEVNKDVVITQILQTATTGVLASGEKIDFIGRYFSDMTTKTTRPNITGDVEAVIFYTPVTP